MATSTVELFAYFNIFLNDNFERLPDSYDFNSEISLINLVNLQQDVVTIDCIKFHYPKQDAKQEVNVSLATAKEISENATILLFSYNWMAIPH